jgi:hypothetical protein
MTSPQTILDTITMLRRRMLEIDRIMAKMERERTSPHAVTKTTRYSARKAASQSRKAS